VIRKGIEDNLRDKEGEMRVRRREKRRIKY